MQKVDQPKPYQLVCQSHPCEMWILQSDRDFKALQSDWCYDGDYSCSDTSTYTCDCRQTPVFLLESGYARLVPLVIWEMGSLTSMHGSSCMLLASLSEHASTMSCISEVRTKQHLQKVKFVVQHEL